MEQTVDNKIIITISSTVDSFGLERAIGYLKYLEATSKKKHKNYHITIKILHSNLFPSTCYLKNFAAFNNATKFAFK